MEKTPKKPKQVKKHVIFTFEDLFYIAKQRIVDHKLSFSTIEENTNISPELLALLFDDSNNIIKDISKLLTWLNYKYSYKELVFRVYGLEGNDNQLRIFRTIKPKCHCLYDIRTEKYYNFRTYPPKMQITELRKETILSEMKNVVEHFLENH